MNWYKTTLTRQKVNSLQSRFMKMLLLLPRPQMSFMYESEKFRERNESGDILYEIYFTPQSIADMGKLLNEFDAKLCEKPKRTELVQLCTIKDYEDEVWEEWHDSQKM